MRNVDDLKVDLDRRAVGAAARGLEPVVAGRTTRYWLITHRILQGYLKQVPAKVNYPLGWAKANLSCKLPSR